MLSSQQPRRWPPQGQRHTAVASAAGVAASLLLALLTAAATLPAAVYAATTPLNKRWVMTDMCQYGSLPGTFTRDMPMETSDMSKEDPAKNLYYLNHNPLPYDKHWATAPYGSRWQLFHPYCQLQNLIKPVLDFTAPKPIADAVKIIIISDSIDTHLLEWIGEHHHRKFGADSEQMRQLNYTAFLHDRGPRDLNHAISTSGLLLFHRFLLTLNRNNTARQPNRPEEYDPIVRVLSTRSEFDRLMKLVTGDTARTFEPDLVLIHCNYWTLHEAYFESFRNDTAPFMLSMDYLQSYIKNFTDVAITARQVFPKSLLMARTASMIRHDYTTGAVVAGGGRYWANRMHVAQLNQALRAVSQMLWLPLLDEEMMTSGLTPWQALYDDIHLNEAVSWEAVNVLLNWVQQYRAELAARRRRGR